MSNPGSDASDVVGAGELRSTKQSTGGVVEGAAFGRKEVRFSNIDGNAIFEGDIILGTVGEVQRRDPSGKMVGKGVRITGSEFRWPDKTVPFQIASSLPDPQRVRAAISEWEARTAIRFVERTGANATQFPDFISFEPGGGCASHVGRQGGKQAITLGPLCSKGNAIHEIGHALGLWHEQGREDRDTHVTIHLDRAIPGTEHNFDQHITDGDDVGDYDHGSIMHYPRDAFSRDGSPTIEPKDPTKQIGQRERLSQGDIDAVNTLYP